MSHIPPNYPPRYESPSLTVRLQQKSAEVRNLHEKLRRAKNTMTNLHKGLKMWRSPRCCMGDHQECSAKTDLWVEIMAGIEEHIATGKEMDFCLISPALQGSGTLRIIKGAVPTATGVAAPTRLPSISEQSRGVEKLTAVTEATDAFKDTLAVALNNHPLS